MGGGRCSCRVKICCVSVVTRYRGLNSCVMGIMRTDDSMGRGGTSWVKRVGGEGEEDDCMLVRLLLLFLCRLFYVCSLFVVSVKFYRSPRWDEFQSNDYPGCLLQATFQKVSVDGGVPPFVGKALTVVVEFVATNRCRKTINVLVARRYYFFHEHSLTKPVKGYCSSCPHVTVGGGGISRYYCRHVAIV